MGKKITKLFNKNFLLLWQGQVVSTIGSQVAVIAMALWIKDRLDSASVLGLSMMLHSLVSTIVAPFSGAFVDNVSRKKTIVVSDLIAGFITILVAVIFFIPEVSPIILIVAIIGYDICDGILSSFLNPAVMAVIPDIVPLKKLEKANSFASTGIQLSVIAGQAIGGLLFKIFGAPLLLLIDGITYFFSALSEMFIHVPDDIGSKKKKVAAQEGVEALEKESAERAVTNEEDSSKEGEKITVKKLLLDLKDGLMFVYKDKGMTFTVFGFALMNLFISPFMVLLPFYVDDFLKIEPIWYGTLLSVYAVGIFLGFILATVVSFKGKMQGIFIGILMVLFAVLTGMIAFILHVAFVIVAFAVAGMIMGYFGIIHQSILQCVTPKKLRGRVFALVGTISGALMPIGMGLTGVIADLIDKNVPLIFATSSMLLLILSIFLFFNKHSINFFSYEIPTEEELSEEPVASTSVEN